MLNTTTITPFEIFELKDCLSFEETNSNASEFLKDCQAITYLEKGPLMRIIRCSCPPWLKDYHCYNAIFAHGSNELIEGYGDDLCDSTAIAKAIAEGVERYCVAVLPTVVKEQWNALMGCPSGIVETSGVACHQKFQKAVEKALLEAVERDALIVNWISNRPLKKICFDDDLPHNVVSLLDSMENFGFSISLFVLSLDIPIPVVAAVGCVSNEKGSPLSFGVGTAFDFGQSCEQALLELSRILWANSIKHNIQNEQAGDPRLSLDFFKKANECSLKKTKTFWKINSFNELLSYFETVGSKIYGSLINTSLMPYNAMPVVKVASPDLHWMINGKVCNETVNWKRLNRFNIDNITNNISLSI